MSGGHAAVLLAAGGSSRLGRPKQLLTRDGEALVQRMARLLSATAPRRLLVVVGAQCETVVVALRGIACETVFNPAWQRGLASSLQAAADALSTHAGPVLVAGCDQPALSAAHLQALIDGAAAAPLRCAATLHDGMPGIPAVVPAQWFAHGDAAQGDTGFAARLRALPRSDLFLLDAPELAFDLDTPDDVAAARARGLLDPGD